ncbi:protein ARV1 [Anomaloglossus baeobatrachus]|uniref:protein ARV1 n=1 Tax=Anomaloglossus baeobatrachus TaxID=238106 RepID=UPI003F508F64
MNSDGMGVNVKPLYRCIECNKESSELYRDYKHGVLKITICVMTLNVSRALSLIAIACGVLLENSLSSIQWTVY